MDRLHKIVLSASVALALAVSTSTAVVGESSRFRRGDADADTIVNLGDVLYTLNFLFLGGPSSCEDAADSNDDGWLDISDPVYSLVYLFLKGPEPPAPGMGCGSDPTDDRLDCSVHGPCQYQQGQSEFSTPLDGAPGAAYDERMDAGMDPNPQAPPAAETGSEPERAIEEADLYRIVGNHIFVLNQYRGLQVIDLSNLNEPRIVGQAPIFGYPKEMYVRGNRAYVLVSDYYTFWRDEEAPEGIPPHGFYGSQLRILDIADPANPTILGGINLEGELVDSRIVGDIMYLVASRWAWYYRYGSDDTENKTTVLSVSIADPANVHTVDSAEFPRDGWEHHIMVNSQAIYLAASGYENGNWQGGYVTRIRYIDISDPAGSIALRGEARAEGRVQDRWSMDEYEGVLRVASGQSWGNGDIHLTTFSVADPDNISRLGRYTLRINERLTSARFSGPRGYLVSYRNIDPLFVFDLSDPAQPVLLGELVMTGWLDFMVPLGNDRIVALGHEDIVHPDGRREISLAVSLVDVSADQGPRLLDRVVLDGAWGWVPGDRDDFAKVFRTLPDQGLILFPFQAWSRADYRYIGGVQLVDFDRDTLTLRGLIQDAGWVQRGIPHGDNTVLTLSNEIFQVMDITDRDAPQLLGRLELARNVQDFAPLPGDTMAVQLAGDWYRGDTELIVTTLDDPNAAEPLARLHVPSPYGRLFVNGSMVYVASVQDIVDETDTVTGRTTVIQVVDLTDPLNPTLRGSVLLPEQVWPGYHWWYWGWGDEAVQVNGSTLAFHRYYYPWILMDDRLNCRVGGGGPIGGNNSHDLYLVDLSDPDVPVLASTVTMDDVDWAWGLKAVGSTLYLSYYQSFVEKDRWSARYFLRRIEVADPANPNVLPGVNIPGMFVDASMENGMIYTLESWWDAALQNTLTYFHVLALDGERAVLQSSVELAGSVNSVRVVDGAAFATLYRWEIQVVDEMQYWTNHSELVAIDVSDPAAAQLASRTELLYDYAYLREVAGGRVFLGSGIGIFTYRVDDITQPVFEDFFRTQGWSQQIIVVGDRAFVPSGYYGVQVLDLAPAPADGA